MNRFLTAAAAAALMIGASGAYAQDGTQLYIVGEGEAARVMGGGNAEGVVILGDDTFAAPSVCPEGSFYRSSANTLTECGADGRTFALTAPAAGTTTVPAGAAFLLTEEDNDDSEAPTDDTMNDAGDSNDNDGDNQNNGDSNDNAGGDADGGTDRGDTDNNDANNDSNTGDDDTNDGSPDSDSTEGGQSN